jgi:RimJ/RimL family protein N-acetyltransferase
MFDNIVWRDGYATEAVLATCQFARDHLGLAYVMAVALCHNLGSIAVMKKCGLKFESELEAEGYTLVRYGISL